MGEPLAAAFIKQESKGDSSALHVFFPNQMICWSTWNQISGCTFWGLTANEPEEHGDGTWTVTQFVANLTAKEQHF